MKKLLTLLAAIVFLRQIPHFVPPEIAWDIYSITKQLQVALFALYAFSHIPYKKLAIKSLLAIWIITEFADACNLGFWLMFQESYNHITIIKAVLSLGWLLYIWLRNYDREDDLLDDDNFFLISCKPSNPQDFLLSLIRDPVGGSGIYYQDKFYHYRKGILQVHNRRYIELADSKYIIRRIRLIDEKRVNVLNSLPGSKYAKWSLLYNCKTVLAPILSSRGKPII